MQSATALIHLQAGGEADRRFELTYTNRSKAQAYGHKAKEADSSLVFGKAVPLQTYSKDKYGRTLADVLLPDGTNANHMLVAVGWCWWYRKYAPGDVVLEELEKAARVEKRGLWADPQPVPPWE